MYEYKGEVIMALEESKLSEHSVLEDVIPCENLFAGDEDCYTREKEARERSIFGLALAIASEPSKLGQLREMLAQLRAGRAVSEEFSSWAMAQVDERLMSMALEYAHDAEIVLQLLSFRGCALDRLMLDIEDLYRQEKITQRVYVRAKLLLRDI